MIAILVYDFAFIIKNALNLPCLNVFSKSQMFDLFYLVFRLLDSILDLVINLIWISYYTFWCKIMTETVHM